MKKNLHTFQYFLKHIFYKSFPFSLKGRETEKVGSSTCWLAPQTPINKAGGSD